MPATGASASTMDPRSSASAAKTTMNSEMPKRRMNLFPFVGALEALPNLLVLHDRQRVVDLLNDDDAVRSNRFDRTVSEPIVRANHVGLLIRPLHDRDVAAAVLQDAPHRQLGDRQAL